MAGNKHEQHAEPDAPVDLRRPELRHEGTDADVWAVTKFGIGLLLMCIASLGLAFVVFRYFEGQYGGVLPRAAQSMAPDARHLPPAPQLEVTEAEDLAAQRMAEGQILSSYGWVDREHGIVRIPITHAIELLAASRLPSRQTVEPVSAAPDVTVPTASGLGPKMLPPGGPLAGPVPDALAPGENATEKKTR